MSKIKQAWQCGDCYKVHDTEDEARECCAPEVFEVYVCPVCSEACDTETEAIGCCDSGEEVEYRPSADELERAGQLRLLS